MSNWKKLTTRKRNRPKMVPRRRYVKRHKKISASRAGVTYFTSGQMPFPPRYRCKMYSEILGSISSGQSHNGNQLTIGLNFLNTPIGSNWQNPISAVNTPTGFATICTAEMYTNYRVYSSKVTMQFIPEGNVDTIVVTIVPCTINTAPTTVASSMTQPYNKQGVFSASNNMSGKYNQIITYMSQHKFLGVSARALQDDISGAFASIYNGTPGDQLYWIVNWQTAAASGGTPVNLTNVVPYRVRITYWVEFYNLTRSEIN